MAIPNVIAYVCEVVAFFIVDVAVFSPSSRAKVNRDTTTARALCSCVVETTDFTFLQALAAAG